MTKRRQKRGQDSNIAKLIIESSDHCGASRALEALYEAVNNDPQKLLADFVREQTIA